MGQRQECECELLDHGKRLGPDEDGMTVPAVDEYACEGRKQERGNLTRKTHRAEKNSGSCEPVDEPRGGYASHPGADEGNALSAEKETEVSVAQRSISVCESS